MPRNSLANLVQQTSDYDQFSFLGANREQARGHVEALKKAFEEVGNLTKVQPILVNENYQIIDGQHRFTACKELGVPIFYTMVNGLGVREARSMNILHRNWTTDDYARSYAETGDTNYQRYIIIKEDYGFNHSVTLAYIIGDGADGSSKGFKEFRNGELVIENEKEVRDRLDKLSEVGEYTSLVTHRPFAIALLKVLGSEQYDHKRMVSKIRRHGDRLLTRMVTVEDNLRLLEEVFNYNQAERNRSRLY